GFREQAVGGNERLMQCYRRGGGTSRTQQLGENPRPDFLRRAISEDGLGPVHGAGGGVCGCWKVTSKLARWAEGTCWRIRRSCWAVRLLNSTLAEVSSLSGVMPHSSSWPIRAMVFD